MNLNAVRLLSYSSASGIDSHGASGTDAASSARAGWRALGKGFAAVLAYVAEIQRRRRDLHELSAFSDKDLSDIGLNRGDVGRIHEPEFAADYAERHAARRPLA